jgi:RimJ/RimL family protein N-acetyltransferase
MGEATLAHLAASGGVPPFGCCYLALVDGVAAGAGAFVAPPSEGRVEIAYFTAPEFERRGVAGGLAAHLVQLARSADDRLTVFAKTLPMPSPSSKILERLGFACVGIVQDHEIGDAWLWELPPL